MSDRIHLSSVQRDRTFTEEISYVERRLKRSGALYYLFLTQSDRVQATDKFT